MNIHKIGALKEPGAAPSAIDYDHAKNMHTVTGALAALRTLLSGLPASLLDVGCGRGTWLRAASDMGIDDIIGIDGVDIANEDLLFPLEFFKRVNLEQAWDMGRRFDLVICLEVAEHLPSDASANLVKSLAKHSDYILFSAAAPDQGGQHHVNCQWPLYWQQIFNEYGYACSDEPRRRIWNNPAIEPWYRQNLFGAEYAPDRAGREERILPLVHPDMLRHHAFGFFKREKDAVVQRLEDGEWPIWWYLGAPPIALLKKLSRKLKSE